MHIDVQALTVFDIDPEGRSVTLHALDDKGCPVELNLRVAELGMLAMTLPNLIDAAIRRQYGDPTCRFTYPLEAWMVEQAVDPALVILTLKTADGFGVSFSLPRSKARELSETIAVSVQKELALTKH